jgi:hypothetical protein
MNNIVYYNEMSEENYKKCLTNVREGHHYRMVEWFTINQFLENIENHKDYAEQMGDPYTLK